MQLEISEQAWRDIASIHRENLERFGSAQAAKYSRGFLNLFDVIAANPRMARVRKGFALPYRMHRHGSHLVFYRIDGERIIIARLLHFKQNWQEYL